MKHIKGIGEGSWAEKLIHIVLFTLATACVVLALFGSYTQPRNWLSISVVCTVFLLLIGGLSYSSKRIKTAFSHSLVILFLVAFFMRLLFLYIWPITPVSDFADTYQAAEKLAYIPITEYGNLIQESFSYYYTTWSMHVPFILTEMGILKLFGAGYFAIQVVFSLFGALSCVLTAAIGRQLFGKRAGWIAGAVMALLPLNLFFTGVLTNQHIATFFFLLAIYFLVARPADRKLYQVILAAVSTCISQLIRPEMLIFVLAVLCYLFYTEVIRSTAKWQKRGKRFFLYGITFAGIYLLLLHSVNFALLRSEIIASPITTTNMAYKVATGLNAETLGTWNEADFAQADNSDAMVALIQERLENPVQVASLMAQKLVYQFGTYNYYWCVQEKPQKFVNNWYSALTTEVMHVLFWLCILYLFLCWRGKRRPPILLFIILIGYFMTFAIIEVQNRYNYALIPIFILLASDAAVYLADGAEQWIYKRKQKRA